MNHKKYPSSFLLSVIRVYQKFISPDSGSFRGKIFLSTQKCRYYPTCSMYAYQAIEKYGCIKGVWLGIKRIFRCNPFFQGGIDHLC